MLHMLEEPLNTGNLHLRSAVSTEQKKGRKLLSPLQGGRRGWGQEWAEGSQEEEVLGFGRVCTKACKCGWNTRGLEDFGEPSHCE